eukprot:4820984-Pyramimonas_sp.AAC.2
MNYEDYGLWTMKTIDYGGFGPIMQTPLDRAGDYTADILESALYVGDVHTCATAPREEFTGANMSGLAGGRLAPAPPRPGLQSVVSESQACYKRHEYFAHLCAWGAGARPSTLGSDYSALSGQRSLASARTSFPTPPPSPWSLSAARPTPACGSTAPEECIHGSIRVEVSEYTVRSKW